VSFVPGPVLLVAGRHLRSQPLSGSAGDSRAVLDRCADAADGVVNDELVGELNDRPSLGLNLKLAFRPRDEVAGLLIDGPADGPADEPVEVLSVEPEDELGDRLADRPFVCLNVRLLDVDGSKVNDLPRDGPVVELVERLANVPTPIPPSSVGNIQFRSTGERNSERQNERNYVWQSEQPVGV
jgi:hypothetical protein